MFRKIIVVTLLFLIAMGISILYLILSKKNLTPLPSGQEVISEDEKEPEEKEEKPAFVFKVDDPSPGKEIVINRVTLEAGGFVVIYQDADGKPKNIFAVSDFIKAGTHENVKVSTPRQIFRGETFWVLLHADDGDGTFGYPEEMDIPIVGPGAVPVSRKIVVKES